MNTKVISKINGPVVIAEGDADFAMHDMVKVGKQKLMGEVIKLDKKSATIQVYEDTSGMKIGEEVYGENEPLSLILGPGIIGNIYDGVQRPLNRIEEVLKTGYIGKGVEVSGIDLEKKWNFIPKVNIGDSIEFGSILGCVQETQAIENRILYPEKLNGKIIFVAEQGEYKVTDTIAKVQMENGKIVEINMYQKWPVRTPRPYKRRLRANIPLLTGQRVIDSLFPIAKGGTATIPGGFGTGKTVTQHQLAKWCDADIIVYIGCGERGNEMTQVLEDFPKLTDPRSGRPLMERTVLIANTSNMPVAAREASIYTGITIAEYYRDMGYNVAIMADSTSRWAEALREISGRLEEMPAEEGFPSYLPSRLSEFYGRAGRVETFNGDIGSVSIIGAVSPQGSDFSEPVTQNTRRFVHVFWGLDRDLAYSRHYPSINWIISYSEYSNELAEWFDENINEDFSNVKNQITKLLNEEDELQKIAKVVGKDVLSDLKKLVLEICRCIRVGFLQQNSFNEIDTSVPLEKQFKMMDLIVFMYNESLELIEKGIPLSEIKKLGFFERYLKLKYEINNKEIQKFDSVKQEFENEFKKLENEYEGHIE